jgi:hypothetical protein
MKTIITIVFQLFIWNLNLLYAQKNIIPEVFEYPKLGFEAIRSQNPYILMEIPDSGENWAPNRKFVRNIDPLLNMIVSDEVYEWRNNNWEIVFSSLDSLISDNDGKLTQAYSRRRLNFGSATQNEYLRYLIYYNSDNVVERIMVSRAIPPTSSSWINDYQIFMYYNNGLRVRDSIRYYQQNQSYVTYHVYNNDQRILASYTMANTDSSMKIFYSYGLNGIETIFSEMFDEQTDEWQLRSADTFAYQGGKISQRTMHTLYFDGTNVVTGPFQQEFYKYDASGNTIELITNNYENGWKPNIKTILSYDNQQKLQLGTGYYYNPNTTSWDDSIGFRYLTTPPVGLTKNTVTNSIAIYPNPATDVLNMEIAKPNADYVILDITGRKVMEGKIESEKYRVDLGALNTGIYFLNVYTSEGRSTQKFSVAR